jgi:hypothetical protein
MRTSYLVCYDICDDKRLRKVFQTMRNYGDHLQYSQSNRHSAWALADWTKAPSPRSEARNGPGRRRKAPRPAACADTDAWKRARTAVPGGRRVSLAQTDAWTAPPKWPPLLRTIPEDIRAITTAFDVGQEQLVIGTKTGEFDDPTWRARANDVGHHGWRA